MAELNEDEIIALVCRTLAECETDYMIVGSFSSNAYGDPRSTKDADFVVGTDGGELNRLLNDLGGDFRLDPQMSFETFTGTIRRILHYRPSGFYVELFNLSDDPFDQERFRRRRTERFIGDQDVYVATPEDVIIQKLRWGRPKDIEDALSVVTMQFQSLDWNHIERWCGIHGSTDRLESVRTEAERIRQA